jgi:hypothetical protein
MARTNVRIARRRRRRRRRRRKGWAWKWGRGEALQLLAAACRGMLTRNNRTKCQL